MRMRVNSGRSAAMFWNTLTMRGTTVASMNATIPTAMTTRAIG